MGTVIVVSPSFLGFSHLDLSVSWFTIGYRVFAHDSSCQVILKPKQWRNVRRVLAPIMSNLRDFRTKTRLSVGYKL